MGIPKDMIGGLSKNLVGFLFESVVENPIKATFSSKTKVEVTRDMYNERYGTVVKTPGCYHEWRELGPKDHKVKCLICVPQKWLDLKDPDEKRPVFYYIHGGGWCYFNTQCFCNFLQYLALKLNVVVISPEYRLAPENPYPSGLDDCYSVLTDLLLHPERPLPVLGALLNLDIKNRLIIGGDSAGGNLSAANLVRLVQKFYPENPEAPRLLGACLVYPVLQNVTNMLPSLQYKTTMASSTINSMMDLSSKYWGELDLGRKECGKLADDAENTDQKDHPMHQLYQNMNPEKYLARVDKEYTKQEGKTYKAICDESYLKKKSGKRAKYTPHPKLYAQMKNPEISPCAADDEVFEAIVKYGPKFIYTMGCEYCGLRDEGLIYMERLRELSNQNKDRYFYSTADLCIHGWLTGSTSWGNGEPVPNASETSKVANARRQWNELCEEWADRIQSRILDRADEVIPLVERISKLRVDDQ